MFEKFKKNQISLNEMKITKGGAVAMATLCANNDAVWYLSALNGDRNASSRCLQFYVTYCAPTFN